MQTTPSLIDLVQRLSVWMKGTAIYGENAAMWRRDCFGNRISWQDYGDKSSPYGWEIDHIHPKALGGSDDIGNLRPLHCIANARLGGGLGQFLKDWPEPPKGGIGSLPRGGLFPDRK